MLVILFILSESGGGVAAAAAVTTKAPLLPRFSLSLRARLRRPAGEGNENGLPNRFSPFLRLYVVMLLARACLCSRRSKGVHADDNERDERTDIRAPQEEEGEEGCRPCANARVE